MSVRLQEIHPSIVHYPLAFYPLSIGADLLGYLRHDRSLFWMGRQTIGLAAGSAALAAVFGLIAQEEGRFEGVARDQLVTHRTINASGLAVMTGMALWRRNHAPGPGYLALGLGLLGGLLYSAYLGGKMVYEHGVGVKPAAGLRKGDSPEVAPGQAGEAARTALKDLGQGARHAWNDMRQGHFAPALRHRSQELGEPAVADGQGGGI